ncbi:MAG: F0F1 ATP synthase subunit A [Candidatus Omnitrophota bacterium]|nr:F0F1 ATP synthase subunit A [Candidatus Omnitrophota bacterium]MBU1929842.1 F0F1 ATP synthase subunit A [Candidatus Omnitrophota bacterium]MBU2034681.1 F0F1 ATP synthase subunit A [Candidatus Omnitrophota bacterium]MBU2222199.1 F0F1 ATP synthase subunit A [Candidatus Omnitrophota bacterium]MBU2258574.1 F0F1 ATP synthase subunit A [Candidatus Omnitrophota bacterium]
MGIWRDVICAFGIVSLLSLIAWRVSRKATLIPGRLQSALELFAAGTDDFVCGILGPKGRRYTSFIGTLFIFILFMNLLVVIPFMKSPTASWSTTLGLALCVFVYVQYSAIRELGFLGYLDHLMGKPRGILAFSLVIPLLMFFMHIIGELIKPLSLSLRLRSNIWGDEMLMAIVAGFGLKGVILLFFNTIIAITEGIIQAFVFGLLTTIYFAIYLVQEE